MDQATQLSPATDALLRPPGFELDDWQVFRQACSEGAGVFASALSRLVSSEIEFELDTAKIGPASELIAEMPAGIRMVVAADGWNDRLVICAPRQTAYVATDRLLGGAGSLDRFDAAAPISECELRTVGFLLHYFAGAIEAGMPDAAPPGLQPAECETTLSLDEVCRPSEPAVAIHFKSLSQDCRIDITLLVLQRTLLNVGEPLMGAQGETIAAADPVWKTHFEHEVRKAGVRLSAVMSGGVFTLDQLSRLHAGQLLELPVGPDSLVDVSCNGKALMRCKLGQSDGAFMLRVEQAAVQEQDLVEELMEAAALNL